MSKIAFSPSPGFILVKTTDKELATVIDVVSEKDKRPNQGEVVAVGSEALHESGERYGTEVKKGDFIVFKPYGVEDIYIEGVAYMIIPFDNVRGILNEK